MTPDLDVLVVAFAMAKSALLTCSGQSNVDRPWRQVEGQAHSDFSSPAPGNATDAVNPLTSANGTDQGNSGTIVQEEVVDMKQVLQQVHEVGNSTQGVVNT